jgi:hypothetical protein
VSRRAATTESRQRGKGVSGILRIVTPQTSIPLSTTIKGIQWEQEDTDGTKSATLVGSRKPGVTFTYAFFIPAGLWDQPHTHAADAHLVVPKEH